MEKQTQQRDRHPSTRSLLHHCIPPKSDTPLDEKQNPTGQKIERCLRIFGLFKPDAVWTILVITAVCDYSRSLDVFRFLILMGAAAGYISLREAINLLSKLINPPHLLEGKGDREDAAEK